MTRCVLGCLLVIVLASCAESGERAPLPFKNVLTDVSLSLPAGTMGRGCEDGAFVGTSCFDPPVHPVGEVHSLSIEGHTIALADPALVDGMLRTRQFGDLEFSISRIDPSTGRSFDILATAGQVRKMRSWLDSEPADAAASTEADVALRFDGLYRGSHDKLDYYLRFYADGSVVDAVAGAPSTAEQVGVWLGLHGQQHARGRYQVAGRVLRFSTQSVDFTFDYSGRIDPDGLTLRLSRFIGPGGFDADYVFTRLENMPQ